MNDHNTTVWRCCLGSQNSENSEIGHFPGKGMQTSKKICLAKTISRLYDVKTKIGKRLSGVVMEPLKIAINSQRSVKIWQVSMHASWNYMPAKLPAIITMSRGLQYTDNTIKVMFIWRPYFILLCKVHSTTVSKCCHSRHNEIKAYLCSVTINMSVVLCILTDNTLLWNLVI